MLIASSNLIMWMEISGGIIDVRNHRIVNLDQPQPANEAATMAYVDSKTTWIEW